MVDIKQRQVNCFLPIPYPLFYRKMNVICFFFVLWSLCLFFCCRFYLILCSLCSFSAITRPGFRTTKSLFENTEVFSRAPRLIPVYMPRIFMYHISATGNKITGIAISNAMINSHCILYISVAITGYMQGMPEKYTIYTYIIVTMYMCILPITIITYEVCPVIRHDACFIIIKLPDTSF